MPGSPTSRTTRSNASCAVASWGEELSPNAIEVYVSRLRAKLEPSGVRIRTVRGFGYMLEDFREEKLG